MSRFITGRSCTSSSNPSLKSEITRFFKKDIKTKDMCINDLFWISAEMPYIDIRIFNSELYVNRIIFQNDTIKSDEQHRNFYKSLTGRADLENFATTHERQPLRLVFSRVFGNVVLAELLLDHNPAASYKEVTRLGRGLRFLIYFEKSGRILRVVTAGITYG